MLGDLIVVGLVLLIGGIGVGMIIKGWTNDR